MRQLPYRIWVTTRNAAPGSLLIGLPGRTNSDLWRSHLPGTVLVTDARIHEIRPGVWRIVVTLDSPAGRFLRELPIEFRARFRGWRLIGQ